MCDNKTNPVKPFWSWNDKLEAEELKLQIDAMKKSGIGGFFMHARGGLITDYMGEEWFDMIEACLDKADETGTDAWAYDENGWPSGFASGIVPQKSVEYQQKKLFCTSSDKKASSDWHILGYFAPNGENFDLVEEPVENGITIFYTVNPYYVDTFNSEAIACFIEETHEKYYTRFKSRFGNSLKGFFTDEPQYGNSSEHLPWSTVLVSAFAEKYGYDLIPVLPSLFYNTPDCAKVRSDFYNLVSSTFNEAFIKQMYDWCEAHNCKLTGHMMAEDSLRSQMASTSGVMPSYEYFHEPGIDWLCRKISDPLTPKQLGSVAAQLNKKTMTETFALCGWDVSLNELKWIAQWQYVNGVTSLCPHLEGYTLRGFRKRDYPASLFTQLPWFDSAYSQFNKYFSRLGAMLDAGKEHAPLLVVHMLQSAYTSYCYTSEYLGLKEVEDSFVNTIVALNGNHIPHHYGDETIMSRHGSVSGNCIKVGGCEYNAVLLPDLISITENTVDLLCKFAENGGDIYVTGKMPVFVNGRPSEKLVHLAKYVKRVDSVAALKPMLGSLCNVSISTDGKENQNIHMTERVLPDGERLFYLVNLSSEPQSVQLKISGELNICEADIINDKNIAIDFTADNGFTVADLDFAVYGSMIIKTTDEVCLSQNAVYKSLALNESFDIKSYTDNALTLDTCRWRISGGEWQDEIAVILLQNKLLELKKPCDIEMEFRFFVKEDFDFDTLCLNIEVPEKYSFTVNGEPFDFEDCGYFVDKSFRSCHIGHLVKIGENVIGIKGNFYQSPDVYRVLFTPGVSETEFNKLTYDTELESIYLTGKFGVEMEGDYTIGDKRCIFGGRRFSLVAPKSQVNISNVTPQGFWFFSGKLSLEQKLTLNKESGVRYMFALQKLHAPAAKVYVNGEYAGILAFAPFELDVTDLLKDGENVVELELLSGNRNLLGPHHKPEGEVYSVGPSTFSDVRGWADDPALPTWTDNYNFVLFGAEL